MTPREYRKRLEIGLQDYSLKIKFLLQAKAMDSLEFVITPKNNEKQCKNSENLMEKQYKTTNGFTNTTNLKLFVAYMIAIIKSQDLGKTKNEKRLRFYENNWQ